MLVDRTPIEPEEIESLQAKLGARVPDELLRLALTHPSAVGEGIERTLKSNQRLEFLGDTILGSIVAQHLFRTYSELPEGILTQRKAAIVQRSTLARVAARLELGRYLIVGRGEHNAGGRGRNSILSDALEAVIAAIFLSHGLDGARDFVLQWFDLEIAVAGEETINVKNRLQEWTQANRLGTPIYRSESLPNAAQSTLGRRFQSEVLLRDEVYGRGQGKTKKAAECEAAQQALEMFNVETEIVAPILEAND